MSKCGDLSASMTGSRNSGPLQPPEYLSALPRRYHESEDGHCHQSRRKMTPVASLGQPIQLTPLWEHVVRTRKFPTEVDVRSTFIEISGRLRDPEWEVRQHALRVLVDVLPTLDVDVMDKVMQPVVPELINNLGHSAPAIRKGALDTLRVYVLNSRDRDSTVQRILHEGLNRCGVHDVFQTNVTTGVILSAPSLLFPSSNSPRPSASIVREVTTALASRLVQVTHQEAVVKSLLKIREAIGQEEFDTRIREYDESVLKHLQALSEVYDVKPRAKSPRKRPRSRRKREKIAVDERQGDGEDWDSDSDTSGIVEEEDEAGTMPAARVVLETEIKFNEETAITMTILEEKDEDSEDEDEDEESGTDLKNDDEKVIDAEELNDRRRTPRRVHFGGEVVKLRTPDSDETESIGPPAKTRIPLPVSPATKLPPKRLRRRSSSQPEMGENVDSPVPKGRRARRKSRSVSNSPRKERYVHNAEISPKKGILSRPSSPVFVKPVESQKTSGKKKNAAEEGKSKNDQRDTRTPVKISDEKKVIRVSEISSSAIEKRNAKEETKLVRSSGSAATETQLSSHPENTGGVEDAWNSSPRDTQKSGDNQGNGRLAPEASQGSASTGNETEKVDQLENSQGGISKTGDSATKCDSVFGSIVDEETKEGGKRKQFGASVSDSQVTVEPEVDASAAVTKSAKDEVNANLKSPERNSTRRTQGWVASGNRSEGVRCSSSEPRDNESAAATKPIDNVTCSSSESEGMCQEPSWEGLGLVGQEVLDDLHNKEDWRARVRGLERVASALRTPSALATVEPRLGSLLHTALGGERSCRVAAAGLSVAKVVISGVSEAALKRRLPQLAWGLARQGGPNAAQLARIAMLRLKPALFLEQLLQPQCLGARNAKTRENALQLLIYSLVTFPSTEFTLGSVAGKVVSMVCDRRRRVRQAALDTLAVLAQVYDSEDVLEAGKKEAKSRHDGESMIAAIRARLARKSLPLVSADGLVVYGLQISPTVQIVTGPDVDWIVAGSGSVSPGTGRTRGQIIATSAKFENDKQSRNGTGNPWTNKSNLVALGVALRPDGEPPVAWQFVPRLNQDDLHSRDDPRDSDNSSSEFRKGGNVDVNLNAENSSSRFYGSPKRTYRMVEGNGVNYGERIVNNLERNRSDHRSNDSIIANSTNYKMESRIPVLNSRGTNTKLGGQTRDKPASLESINESFRKGSKDEEDNNGNKRFYQEDNAGFRNMYQRRKQVQQENNGNAIVGNETTKESFDSSFGSYRQASYTRLADRDMRARRNESFAEIHPQAYHRLVDNERFTRTSDGRTGNPRPYSIDSHQQMFSRNLQQTVSTHDAYNSYYQQQRRNLPVYRALQTAPGPLARAYQQYQNSNMRNDRISFDKSSYERGTRDAASQKVTEIEQVSTDAQTNGHPRFLEREDEHPFRRRLRSLSPTQLYQRDQHGRLTIIRSQATSMYDIDKSAVNEEACNERNKHNYSSQTDAYEIRPTSRDENRLEDGIAVAESNSSSSSETSTALDQGGNVQAVRNEELSSDSRSSSAQSRNADKAFDVITEHSSPARNATEPTVVTLVGENDIPGSANASIEEVMSKEWSSEDENRNEKEASVDRVDFAASEENDTDDTLETALQDGKSQRRVSIVSIHSPSERSRTPNETASSKYSEKGSPGKSLQSVGENTEDAERMTSPSRRKSLVFEQESDTSDERIAPSALQDENVSFRQLDDEEHHEEPATDSNNSNETAESETKENSTHNTGSVHTESSTNENTVERTASKDVAFSTIPPHPMVQAEQTRRQPSRVPRSKIQKRSTSNKVHKTEKSVERTKPMVQQCFTQLESKDWEVAMKGLKSLSQIAKQHPEYLDLCMAGTVSRLLGRHVKNLRSQVARAACMSAADLFSAQIRGVDQDLDDIAGPLLHRTADTNRFLRADCNAALDKMVEHVPPHKTIAVIVHRGANHQNAIVRAATARLLAQVVDRIGPDHAMILPRDVREKLLATGAKLLIDGNLDARNHAKKMFRRLTRCEGFRKALTDSVSESTLRHIDKTLKSL